MGLARCREHDPDKFFVKGATRARRALRVCEGCSVREQCLSYALRNHMEFGIWGGLTEQQRRRLQRTSTARQ